MNFNNIADFKIYSFVPPQDDYLNLNIKTIRITKVELNINFVMQDFLKKLEEGAYIIKTKKNDYATTRPLADTHVNMIKTKKDQSGNIIEKTVEIDLRKLTDEEKQNLIMYVQNTIEAAKSEFKKEDAPQQMQRSSKRKNHVNRSFSKQEQKELPTISSTGQTKKAAKQQVRQEEKQIEEVRIAKRNRKKNDQENLDESSAKQAMIRKKEQSKA